MHILSILLIRCAKIERIKLKNKEDTKMLKRAIRYNDQLNKDERPRVLLKALDYPSDSNDAQSECFATGGEEKQIQRAMAYVLDEERHLFDKICNVLNTAEGCGNKLALQILKGINEEKPINQMQSAFNFTLTLRKIRIDIADTPEGETQNFIYGVEVVVRLQDGKHLTFTTEITSDKIKDPVWLRKATHSYAHIPRGKDEMEIFQRMVQDCLESNNYETEIVYPSSGWRNVEGLGWKYIIAQGIIGDNINNIHTLAKYKLNYDSSGIGLPEVCEKALQMCHICKDDRTSTLIFLFFHASLMTKLFELAGFPIKFAFGLIGLTNSRKTSVATAMAQLFNRQQLRADAEFVSTSCGIEKALGLYGDSIVIIDDFKPGATKEKQRAMDDKLEMLVRFCGDRVEKQRMLDFSVNATAKYFPIRGACLITGELISGVSSSLSRMFLTEIGRDDVDNERLAYYQGNYNILATHAYDFITWLTEDFDKIVERIRERFQILRKRHNFVYPRFSDMFATMTISAEMIAEYGTKRRFMSIEEANAYLEDHYGKEAHLWEE